MDHNSKSGESFIKTLEQLDERETHRRKEAKATPRREAVEDPKPKLNENSPPEKKPSKETPPKETTANKLSSKLKRFQFVKEDNDAQKEGDELQHKDKKVKLESTEKEKIPRDKKPTPKKKESTQADVKAKSEHLKNIKDENVDAHSKKASKESIKEERTPQKEEKKVTPKKEDTQAPHATPDDDKKKTAYMKFLRRSGPANPGSKSIPEVTLSHR